MKPESYRVAINRDRWLDFFLFFVPASPEHYLGTGDIMMWNYLDVKCYFQGGYNEVSFPFPPV